MDSRKGPKKADFYLFFQVNAMKQSADFFVKNTSNAVFDEESARLGPETIRRLIKKASLFFVLHALVPE